MNKFDGIVGLLGVTAGLIGVGFALGTHSKMAKISEKLDRSIEELANDMPVDIPDDMIERAVEKAVAAEVKTAVSKATDTAIVDVKRDIHKQVSDVVESEYSNIKGTVLEELTAEAAKIDVKRVRSDIERAAKERAMEKFDDDLDDILEKFDDDLDDILEKFNDQLENTSKIYSSIADTLSKVNNRETVVRLG